MMFGGKRWEPLYLNLHIVQSHFEKFACFKEFLELGFSHFVFMVRKQNKTTVLSTDVLLSSKRLSCVYAIESNRSEGWVRIWISNLQKESAKR